MKRQASQVPSSPAAAGTPAANVQRLLELIGGLNLKVGDRLPNIRVLAQHMSVKPTEARDALLQAQVMGLVKILPRSGAYVQSLTYATLVDAVATTLGPALLPQDHNLLQLLDARRFIEVELAGRAAKHRRLEDLLPVREALEAMADIPQTRRRLDYVQADIAFHTEIARLAGNSLLLTFQQATLQLLEPHLSNCHGVAPAASAPTDRTLRSIKRSSPAASARHGRPCTNT